MRGKGKGLRASRRGGKISKVPGGRRTAEKNGKIKNQGIGEQRGVKKGRESPFFGVKLTDGRVGGNVVRTYAFS